MKMPKYSKAQGKYIIKSKNQDTNINILPDVNTSMQLNTKQKQELFEMSKKIRTIFIDYENLPIDFRIAYALVVARTLASENEDTNLVKAIENAQSLIPFKVFKEYITTLKKVYRDVKGREYKD